MNAFALSGFLILLSSSAMAVFMFWKNPSGVINRLWAVFCLLVATWGMGALGIGLSKTPETSLFFWKSGYAGVVFIPTVFYHFVIRFLGLKRRKRLLAAYLLSVFFWIADVSSIMMHETEYMFNEMHFMVSSEPTYVSFFIYFLLMVFISHVYLVKFMYTSHDEHKKNQVKWFFAATLIGFTGGVTCFFPSLGLKIYPYGNFSVVLHPIIMGYAIIKHQLMDIKIVIKRTIFYSIFAIVLSFIYLTIVFACYSFFLDKPAPSLVINVGAVLFIAAIFKPLEIVFHRSLEKRFFKGTIHEISEQKEKLEEELQRRERLKSVGILAAGLVHEIKNPLTSIKTFAEYLPQKREDKEFCDKFSDLIVRETDRIIALTHDLLTFSKPHEPQKVRCSIGQIIRDIERVFAGQFSKNSIEFKAELSDSVEIFADPHQLKQAFLNIILNSIDAMKERDGGKLTVNVFQEKKVVKIVIRDTGCGIPGDKLKNIFDPFYTGKQDGTGLGLAITHSIIERHEGKIFVESRVGQGTNFTIELPAGG